jgi:PAS domain S-box-containing protein
MSTDSIVISDLDAKIIDVNEATLKMYGTDDKGDLIGKNSFDLIAPEDREKALAGTKETLEKGYLESREYNIITKDGSRIPVEMSAAIMKDVNRKPIGFVAISRDISERKRMEEALAKSEEKFRSIFESASDCMIFLDRSGRILDVNRKAVEVFGGSKKELVGKHFTKVGVFSPRDIPTLMSSFAKGLAGKRSAQDVRIKNRKSQDIPLECSTSLLKIAGKFAGMLIIARDIAERKKAEEKLRASEEKYRSIVELAPDSIMTFNLKGVITSVNTASTRLSGYSKDELVGKHFSNAGILRAKDIPKYLKMLPSTARGNVPAPFEVTYRCKDGTLRLGEVHMSLMREEGKIAGIQAIMRDITQRKQMEDRYRDLVENEKDIIYTLDGKGNITFSSPAVEAVLGYQSEEVVGKNFMALIIA